MKAAVLNRNNGLFDIEDIEIDGPQGREVTVQVRACGLCHSDLHLAQADYGFPLPAVVGHEVAGIVIAVGPEVTEFALGDHVCASLIRYCGHCGACASDRTFQCTNPDETLRASGGNPRLSRNGAPITQVFGTSGFAEYALVHENQLAKVPKELPFPQAAILGCCVITGAGSVINTALLKPGDTAAVLGIGGVGLNVIAGAVLAGAGRIVAIDMQAKKEGIAKKFGATDFICAADGDPVAAVQALLPGGPDHVFEVVGLKATSEQAIKMARLGGHVYMIGLPKPNSPISLDVLVDMINRQLTLHGMMMGASNIKHDIPFYADLYLKGRFRLDDLISQEINISQINEAYQELKGGALARSVITSF